MTQLFIKNMVCPRCVEAVRDILRSHQLPLKDIGLGFVQLTTLPSDDQLERLSNSLSARGFELLRKEKRQISEQIKTFLIQYLQEQEEQGKKYNISILLSQQFNREYSGLCKAFKSTEGYSINQYFGLLKIERAKELISYGELNISQIAYQLHFSSPAHLSSQFKKITGIRPTDFKQSGLQQRRSLHEIGH